MERLAGPVALHTEFLDLCMYQLCGETRCLGIEDLQAAVEGGLRSSKGLALVEERCSASGMYVLHVMQAQATWNDMEKEST